VAFCVCIKLLNCLRLIALNEMIRENVNNFESYFDLIELRPGILALYELCLNSSEDFILIFVLFIKSDCVAYI